MRAKCCPILADLSGPQAEEQHDVRVESAGRLDCLRAVARFADDVEVVLHLQDHAEPGAHELLVIDDQDADRACPAPSGISASGELIEERAGGGACGGPHHRL